MLLHSFAAGNTWAQYVVDYNVGKWQPTPTAFTPLPLTSQFGKVKPFVINDINDYLLSGPPQYSSNEYQQDYLFTYNYPQHNRISYISIILIIYHITCVLFVDFAIT